MCILDLRASKTLIPTAHDMNYVAVRSKLCLPMAAGLPIGGSGDFGTSPFFGQLTDKPLLVSTYISGVSDAKRNRGCGTSGNSGASARYARAASSQGGGRSREQTETPQERQIR